MTGTTADVLMEVGFERSRQDQKWGKTNIVHRSPKDALVVLMEEVGEVARAVLDHEPNEHYRMELIQVAATAVAAVEASLASEDHYYTSEHGA